MGGYYTQQRLKNYAKKLKSYFGLESSLIRPVAKGIWYDKLGGNLPLFWMSTVMSKILTKIGYQKKIYLQMCILQTRTLTHQILLCSS